MCLGNRAEVSAHYINGQLRSLYENAQHCVEKHGTGLKPTASAVEYATCLYEFYGPGKRHQTARTDLSFFAKFGRPRLEFVCMHEVVLFLELVDGHYNLDYNKPTQKRELNEAIENCTLAFRITFGSHAIENFHCAAIGNAAHYTTILLVMNMDSAVFLPEHSEFPGLGSHNDDHAHYSRERKLTALTHYLTKFYLPTLKRAGHHVLHSLPDFDNLTSTSAHIDYSIISTRSLSTDVVYGIRVEEVNRFLCGLWLQAASFVDDYGLPRDTTTESFLAEVRTPSPYGGDDMHLHMRFGPLTVQPLCKREVILYINIQDVLVHYGEFKESPQEHLKDWKIAFIVDIGFEEVSSTRRIRLDMSTARICEHLSFFGEHYHNIEVYTRVRTTLLHYITTQYVKIIETSKTVIIFEHDITIHGEQCGEEYENEVEETCGGSVIDVDGCMCEDEGSCGHSGGIRWGIIQKDIITHTHSSEFDLVTALTQGSINAHFKSLWESARRRISGSKSTRTWESTELELETCLSSFSFVHHAHGDEIFFSASFSAPKVQLICKEGSHSVIFYLHISDGYMKTLGSGKSLQPGSHDHYFSNWRLAFEVDLKIIDSREDTMPICILKRLGLEGPTGLKQLVLALSSAKLNLSLSTVPGLFDGFDYRAIRARREALVYYIQTCYFPVFKRAHHHVLYTLPRSIPSAHHHHHTLTSLRFEIVPFSYASGASHLEGLFGRYRAIFERNTIVIMGMTRGRPLPSCSLPRGHNWVCGYGKEVPHGTVCLSRKSFLEEVLLSKLERINRETTIVPTFSGIKDGLWVLEFAAWDNHKMKAASACNWREITKKSSCEHLEFEWRNRELWRYEHDNDFNINGLYTVSCLTQNILTIPTSRTSKPSISLKGSVKMSLKYEGEGPDWSSETIVRWSTNIVFNTSSSGLQISLQPARIIPEFHTTYASHATHDAGRVTQEQAIAQLKEKFPDFIDFAVLLNDLKAGLEGMWAGVQMHSHELCVARPVFTRRGDLLLELTVRGQHSESNGHSLNGKRSVMSLSGAVTPVHMNGNGHGTNETWFRHVIHKAGDAVSSYSPSISRMSSSLSSASKTTSTSFISQETVTRQSASVEIDSNGNGNGNGEVEEFSDSDGESDL